MEGGWIAFFGHIFLISLMSLMSCAPGKRGHAAHPRPREHREVNSGCGKDADPAGKWNVEGTTQLNTKDKPMDRQKYSELVSEEIQAVCKLSHDARMRD